ncbi:MAG: hypothetical protein TEF_00050 [Rhizobiales bacterium NRL2]|jgi:hypothetical protein|nr:MAG: hypothetical protein TEF_00050 [Rhizobiales bacterium NRL2]
MTRTVFNHASGAARKPSRPAPFSIRLTADERAWLERKAGSKPLGTYIRDRLLGDNAAGRSAVRSPKPDYAMLGKVLAALGPSELATSICMMAKLAERGSLLVDDECASSLQAACSDIQKMRLLLIRALGLRPGGDE